MDSLCVAALLLALYSPATAFAPTTISRGNPRSTDHHVQFLDQHSSSHARSHLIPRHNRERGRDVGERGRGLVLSATAMDRADFVRVAAGAASTLVASSLAKESLAADVAAPVEEKYVDFVDSRGLFSCRIPADFLRAERAKDKKGTVFVSGNYNKAEVLSVQSFTAYELLKDAGEDQQHNPNPTAYELLKDAGFPTVGDLTKWEGLGKPRIIAELLKQRRDSDAAGGGQVESVVLPGIVMEGDVLQFTLKSPIKVMRTDLLEKERGVSELYRNTYVKAIMRGDGSFLIVWAGALNTDWDGEGGAKNRLKEAVDSFRLEGLIVDGVRLGAA